MLTFVYRTSAPVFKAPVSDDRVGIS